MLFEVLSGKRRLSDKSGNEALEYLIRTRFELPRISLTGLPRKYLGIIDAATALNPLDRFQTAEEMRLAFASIPAPEDEFAAEKSRDTQTQRFCEKSALSSALLEKKSSGSKLMRWVILGTSLVLSLLGAVFGVQKYIEAPLLLAGEYHGNLELYGGTNIKRPLRLTVTPEGIQFWSGMDHCRSGAVAKGGDIECGRDGMKLKISSFDDLSIHGEVVDLKLQERHKFVVQRKTS
jgi:hypothetical protein